MKPSGLKAPSSRISKLPAPSKSTTDEVPQDDFIIGDRVLVGGSKPGRIIYLGETKFQTGEWAGIVLDEAVGKHDGSVQGVRYFQCEPMHGMFVRPSKLARQSQPPASKSADSFAAPKASSSASTFVASSSAATTTAPLTPANLRTVAGDGPSTRPQKISGIRSPASSIRSLRLGTPSRKSMSVVNSGLKKEDLKVGDRVSTGESKVGHVRFVGTTDFAKGCWVGIELDEAIGKNDGSVNGKRYFQCELNHGLFAMIHKCYKLGLPTAGSTAARMSKAATPKASTGTVRRTTMGGKKSPPGSIANSISSVTSMSSIRRPSKIRTEVSSRYKQKAGSGPAALQEALNEKQQHLEQILAERDMERSELMELHVALADVKRERDQLQEQLDGGQASGVNSSEVEAELEKMQKENKELRSQLDEERHKYEDIQFRYEEVAISKEDLEMAITDEDGAGEQQRANRLEEVEKSLMEERSRNKVLERDFEQYRTDYDCLLQEKLKLEHTIDENEKLQVRLTQTRDKLGEAQQAYEDVKTRLDEMSERNSNENNNTRQQLVTLQNDNEKLHSQLRESEEDRRVMRMKVETMGSEGVGEMERIVNENSQLTQQLHDLRTEKDKAAKNASDKEKVNEKNLAEYKLKETELEKRLEKIQNKCAEVENEKLKSQQQVQRLSEQLASTTQLHNETKQTLESMSQDSDEKTEHLLQQLRESQEAEQQSREKINNHKTALDEALRRSTQLQLDLERSAEEVRDLQVLRADDEERANTSIRQLNEDAKQLRKKLDDSERMRKSSEKYLEQSEQDVNEKKYQLTMNDQVIQRQTKELKEIRKKLENFEKNRKANEKHLEQSEQELKDKKEQIVMKDKLIKDQTKALQMEKEMRSEVERRHSDEVARFDEGYKQIEAKLLRCKHELDEKDKQMEGFINAAHGKSDEMDRVYAQAREQQDLIDELRTESAELASQSRVAVKKAECCEQQMRKLEEQNFTLRENVDNLKSVNDKISLEFGEKLKELEFNLNEKEIELKELADDNKKLAEENNEIEKSRENLKKDIEKSVGENESVKRQKDQIMQELGDKLRDVEFNMNEIDIQLKEEKENNKKLAVANQNAEKSRDALKEELEKKKNEMEALEKVKEKVLVEFGEKVKGLESNLKLIDGKLKEEKENNRQLAQEKAQVEKLRDSLKEDVEKKICQLETVQKEKEKTCKDFDEKVKTLENNFVDISKKLNEEKEKNNKLTEQNSELEKSCNSLASENEAKKREMEAMNTQNQKTSTDFGEKVKSLENTLESVSKELNKEKENSQQLTDQNSELEKSCTSLKEENEKKTQENEAVTNQSKKMSTALNEKVKTLEGSLWETDAKLKTQLESNAKLTQQNGEVEKKLCEVDERLKTKSEAFEKLEKQFEDEVSRSKAVKTSLEEEKEKLQQLLNQTEQKCQQLDASGKEARGKLEQQLADVERQLAESRVMHESVRKERDDLRHVSGEEQSRMAGDLREARTERDMLQVELDNVKSLLEAKVEEKRQLAEDRDRQLADKEQQLVKEHELAKKVGAELCDIRAEAEGLRVALQASNQSRDEMSARAERLSDGEKELGKKVEELRAELASGSEKEAAMRKELEVVNASVDFLRQRNDVGEKERDQLQQKLESEQSAKQQLEAKVLDAEKETVRLRESNHELNNNISQLSLEHESKHQHSLGVSNELKREIESLTTKQRESEKQIGELSALCKKENIEKLQLVEDLKATKQSLADNQKKMDLYQFEVTRLVRTSEDSLKTSDELRSDSQQKDKELQVKSSRVHQLQEINNHLTEDKNNLISKVQLLEKSCREVEEREKVFYRESCEERERLQKQLTIATTLAEEKTSESAALRKDIEEVQQQSLVSRREEQRRLNDDNDRLREQNEKLKRDKSLLETKLDFQRENPTMAASAATGGADGDFLNTVIVNLQRKLTEKEAKIKELELMLINGGDLPPSDDDGEGDVDTSRRRGLQPRLFCDICDVFDAHDTEDCPIQCGDPDDGGSASDYYARGESRPYCDICGVFGHWTQDCTEQAEY